MSLRILFFIFFILAGCHTPNPAPPKTQPNDVMAETVKFLAATQPNRSVGEPGHAKAFQFLKEEFEQIAKKSGGKVSVHEFVPDINFAVKNYNDDFNNLIKSKYKPIDPTYIKWRGFTDKAIQFVKSYKSIVGKNLILEIPGAKFPDEVLYVGAHYDTITHNHETMEFTPKAAAPGADDNGSAVAALLAVARELAEAKPNITVRFVAFDFEEIFFLGSYALAKQIAKKKEKTHGLINLEMIGHSAKSLSDKPVVKIYTREASHKDSAKDMYLAEAVIKVGKLNNTSLTIEVLQNGFNRSDNWSFWQNGIPSICITQDWENDFNSKHYHTANDVPTNLNWDYVNEITNLTRMTVNWLAYAPKDSKN